MSSKLSKALQEKIENLYTTFDSYSLQPAFITCDDCISPELRQRLQQVSLRQLTYLDLISVAESGLHGVGVISNYKYLLPRLLEVSALEEKESFPESYFVDPEINFRILAQTEWRTWPEAEQQAIEAYFAALWPWLLETFPGKIAINHWLVGLAQVYQELTPFLESWINPASIPALRHLAGFIYDEMGYILKNRKLDESWKALAEQQKQVITWLLKPATKKALEEAFYQNLNQPYGEELSLAVSNLESLSSVA